MKHSITMAAMVFCSVLTFGQNLERYAYCGTDTLDVSDVTFRNRRTPTYKGFECMRATAMGFRADLGFNTFSYNQKTKKWLGNHNGSLWGIALVYKNFNVGIRFVLASVNPDTTLVLDGELLTQKARLNPIRTEYSIGYSLNFKHNFSIEPYLALTKSSFFVTNEDTLQKHYQIPDIRGLTIGVAANKYFRIKGYQFIALFAKYGYGFTDYAKVNSALGRGYSDISFGIAYKGFGNCPYHKRL